MFRNSLSVVNLVILTLLSTSTAFAQLKVDDPGSKKLQVQGDFVFLSEAPVETIEGTAPGATGEFTTDTTDLTKTRGTLSVPVAGMKTGNKKRDKHLASKNWLDAKTYPKISFEITAVKVNNIDNKAAVKVAEIEATGQFSLHGVTREVTVPLAIKWKGDAVKVIANFAISLSDFDIQGAKGVVGERVGETITLSANLTGSVL